MRSMKSASVALKCIAMAASWMISGADSPMTWTTRTRSAIEDAMNFTKPGVLWAARPRGGPHLRAVLAADDVARRPDVRLARTQLGVDHDEPIVKRHAGSVEPERLGVRRPARGHRQPLRPGDPAGAREHAP